MIPPWDDIARGVSEAIDAPFRPETCEPVRGGDINATYRIRGKGRAYFVKVNQQQRLVMFDAEAAGLVEIAHSATVRVPQPVCCGASGAACWLVLEHIPFGLASNKGMRELGRNLAHMHGMTSERFGWSRDNTIGSTPQVNTPDSDWVAFWRDHRLGYQLELAAKNGHRGRLQQEGKRLLEKLPAFFADYSTRPSLLHGDLWSGNFGFDRANAPVIFDPAVYYGDRETDLAMTELFGGFSPEFYEAYAEALPLDPGYARRKHLYNLYHILNHLNLFGAGYLPRAERMIGELLANA
jgi:protein-ribulosamine 3-kinase